jgi:putative methionine-R-sulfoxide reductase with GAF domain
MSHVCNQSCILCWLPLRSGFGVEDVTGAPSSLGIPSGYPGVYGLETVLKFIRKWRSPAVVALFAGLGIVLHTLQKSTGEWYWLAAAILAAILAALTVPFFRHLDEKTEKSALLKYQEQIGDGLEPLLQQLVVVSESLPGEARNKELASLVRVAIEAARHMAGQRRVRATYYRVHPRKGPKRESLLATHYTGRGTKPKTQFTRGSDAGDYVFKALGDNETIFVKDTQDCDLPGWNRSRVRDYKTFISVPVRGEQRVYGMLTVDAPTVGELTGNDEMFVRCVGLLLASGIATANPN